MYVLIDLKTVIHRRLSFFFETIKNKTRKLK